MECKPLDAECPRCDDSEYAIWIFSAHYWGLRITIDGAVKHDLLVPWMCDDCGYHSLLVAEEA